MSGPPSYVDYDFYDRLMADFTDWQGTEHEISDPQLRDICRQLLEREARLLDANRFDDWLALYAPDCLYWIPATAEAGDPRREVAIAFDDRRRLTDRIFRLTNDYAWSQRPRSRTARLIGGVTVFATASENVLMVRSTFITAEYQPPDTRRYSGWTAHRLASTGDSWEICIKQVNLIDCDRNLRNPSIIL